jgi:hypothetical protein
MAVAIPGFDAVADWTGEGPAPIFLTVSLNVNDFLRAGPEAQAITHFLDMAEALEIHPLEISFTGHVLSALEAAAPSVLERIGREGHSVLIHYRLLRYRKLLTTAHNLYATDPATMELLPGEPGPAIAVQQIFGLTPRDGGGVLGDVLRHRWVEGQQTAALRAQGARRVSKNSLIVHPDRLIGHALDLPSTAAGAELDGNGAVNAYLQVRALAQLLQQGGDLAGRDLVADQITLVRMAQVLKARGHALSSVVGIDELVDLAALPAFRAGFTRILPDQARAQALQARLDDPAARAALEATGRELAGLVALAPDLPTEVAAKLARLDPNKVHVARFVWHASNDHTVEPWAKNINRRQLRTVGTRPAEEQARIAASLAESLAVLMADPRVRVISLDNDSQHATGNAAAVAYPTVFGVELDSLPGSLSAETVESKAQSLGISVPVQRKRTRRQRRR